MGEELGDGVASARERGELSGKRRLGGVNILQTASLPDGKAPLNFDPLAPDPLQSCPPLRFAFRRYRGLARRDEGGAVARGRTSRNNHVIHIYE